MKKILYLTFVACCLLIFTGCNPQAEVKTLTSEEFITDFFNTYLNTEYDSTKSFDDYYTLYSDNIKPYFTEEAFTYLTINSYISIPINALIEKKSTIHVDSVDLETLFKDSEDKMGYEATVHFKLTSTETKEVTELQQPVTLSVTKESGEWKIYFFKIFKVIDELQH